MSPPDHAQPMSDALNRRLEILRGFYAALDAEIGIQMRVIDTYRHALAGCDAVQSAHLLLAVERATAHLAKLFADRAEIDVMWNEALRMRD